jgi:hypothetical protein
VIVIIKCASLCNNQQLVFYKECIVATSPTTRKPAVRSTIARKPAAVKAKVAKQTAPRATKTPVQRSVSTTARKPVSSIVAKNLKPVVAKSVSAVAKTKTVAPTKSITKPKKVKLVRDNFSIPAHEHALLSDLKKRAKKLGKDFKKSEFLRAGIAHLVSLTDTVLVNALSKVERVKVGRPTKKGKKK